MNNIPLEKRQERYDSISQPLRDALNSDVIDQMLWIIGEAHHLGEERVLKMVKIFGLVVMGFIHPEDLGREIAGELSIDRRLAEEITRELQIKILSPLMPEINAAFNYHITSAPTPTPATTPLQPAIIRPAFAPPAQTDQPLILHEEQSGIEQVRPRGEELMRPSFYDPSAGSAGSLEAGSRQEGSGLRQDYGGQAESKPRSAARLEIGPSAGSGQEEKKEPKVGKTEEPPIRVVHYSGPQTPVDPFSPQQIANSKEQIVEPQPPPAEEVHPENIVDLKDLPK